MRRKVFPRTSCWWTRPIFFGSERLGDARYTPFSRVERLVKRYNTGTHSQVVHWFRSRFSPPTNRLDKTSSYWDVQCKRLLSGNTVLKGFLNRLVRFKSYSLFFSLERWKINQPSLSRVVTHSCPCTQKTNLIGKSPVETDLTGCTQDGRGQVTLGLWDSSRGPGEPHRGGTDQGSEGLVGSPFRHHRDDVSCPIHPSKVGLHPTRECTIPSISCRLEVGFPLFLSEVEFLAISFFHITN